MQDVTLLGGKAEASCGAGESDCATERACRSFIQKT